MHALPRKISTWASEDNIEKLSMTFTDVPGSKEDWYITGKRIISYAFSATGSKIPVVWAMISHVDNIKVSLGADKASI